MLFSFTNALVCCEFIVSGDFIKLGQNYICLNKTRTTNFSDFNLTFNTPFMSLVTDTVQSPMMHLRLSFLSSRLVCGGIPVMSMVSVVSSNSQNMRTYGADWVFWSKTLCILPHTLVKAPLQNIFIVYKRSNAYFP